GLVLQPRRGLVGHRGLASLATVAIVFVTGAAIWIEDLTGSGHLHGVAATCAPNHHAQPGMVLRPVPCTVTPEEQAAADRLVAQTREDIAPYQIVNAALAAGYRAGAPDGSGTAHFMNAHPSQDPLDPRHPAALVYASTRHGEVLLGAMYQMP